MNVFDIQQIKCSLNKVKAFEDHVESLFWFWGNCQLNESDFSTVKKAYKLFEDLNSFSNYSALINLLKTAEKNTSNKEFKEMLSLFLKYV